MAREVTEPRQTESDLRGQLSVQRFRPAEAEHGHGFLVTGPDLLAEGRPAWPLERAFLFLESSQPGLVGNYQYSPAAIAMLIDQLWVR